MSDWRDQFQGQPEGDMYTKSIDIHCKDGEGLYMIQLDDDTLDGQLMVREREMKTVLAVLNYNRIPYIVEPLI